MPASVKPYAVYSVIFAGGLIVGTAMGFFGLNRGSGGRAKVESPTISDRMDFDPYVQMAKYSGEKESDVIAACLSGSQWLKEKGVYCHPSTFAVMLSAGAKWSAENNQAYNTTSAKEVSLYENWIRNGKDPCKIAAEFQH